VQGDSAAQCLNAVVSEDAMDTVTSSAWVAVGEPRALSVVFRSDIEAAADVLVEQQGGTPFGEPTNLATLLAVDTEIDDGVTDTGGMDDANESVEATGHVDDDICAYSDTGAVFGTDAGTDYDSDAPSLDRNRSTIVMSLASAVRESENKDVMENERINAESSFSFRSSSVVGSVCDSTDHTNRLASNSLDYVTTPTHQTSGVEVSPRYSRLYHPSLITPFGATDRASEDDDSLIRNNLLIVYSLDLSAAANLEGNLSFVMHDCGFADSTIELMVSAAQAREIEKKTETPILHVCVCHHYFNTEPVLGSFDPRLDDFVILPTFFFGSNVHLDLDGISISSPVYVHNSDGLILEDVTNRTAMVSSVPSMVDNFVNLSDLGKPDLPCANPEHWRVTPCRSTGAGSVLLTAGPIGLLHAQFRITSLCAVALMINPALSAVSNGSGRIPLSMSKPYKSAHDHSKSNGSHRSNASKLQPGTLLECWEQLQASGIQNEVISFDRLSARKRVGRELYDCYLSYWWGLDERGSDVHSRVSRINDELESRGLKTSFNDIFVFGDSTANTMRAIVDSKCMVCFVTQAYLDSVHCENTGHVQSSTRIEFFTAEFRGMFTGAVVVVVLEKRCRKAYLWGGDVGGSFGELLYVDLVEETPECLYTAQIDDLYSKISAVIEQQGLASPRARALSSGSC
jgi:hypothetical protein